MPGKSIDTQDIFRIRELGDPRVSPEGARVVFTVRTADGSSNRYRSDLWLVDREGRDPVPLTAADGADSSPRWSPDGDSIAFLRTEKGITQIWLVGVGDRKARPLTHMKEGTIDDLSWSPDGRRLCFTYRPTHRNWTQEARRARARHNRSTPPRVISRLDYREEGTGYIDHERHVWICRVIDGQAEALTHGPWDARGPVWSPDGTTIAFLANRCGQPHKEPYRQDIWLVPAQGGALQVVPTPDGYKSDLMWSPDGKTLAYVGCETRRDPWASRLDKVWEVPVDGGKARCLTPTLDRPVENATISDVRGSGKRLAWWGPDRMVFLVSDRGNCHLYSVVPGREPERLVAGNCDIAGVHGDRDGNNLVILMSTLARPAELYTLSGRDLEPRPLTRMNADWLASIRLNPTEAIWFSGRDGIRIQGWMIKPADFDPGRTYPLVLFVHGGPDMQVGNTFFHELQFLAAQGLIVLAPNPRGSSGYGEDFATAIEGNWGGLDFQDLMVGVDEVASLPFVDAERMAVMGGSYGGFMVAWVVAHTDRFQCAIAERGVYNRHSAVGTSDFPPMPDGYWPGNAWNAPERLWQQSPLGYSDQIQTPLMLIHGEGDLRCPIEQAEQLFSALKRLDREVTFVRYPETATHGLARNGPPDLRIDRLERIVGWLKKYLI